MGAGVFNQQGHAGHTAEASEQAHDDDARAVQAFGNQPLHVRFLLDAVQADGVHAGEIVGQERARGGEREQVGVGVAQQDDVGGGVVGWARRGGGCGGGGGFAGEQTPVVRPGVVVENEIGEVGGRRQVAVGGEHGFDVIENGEDLLAAIDRVKPDGAPVEDEQNHVCQRAGSKTTALGQVDFVAQFAAFPFGMVEVGRHRRMPAFGMSTATACGADHEMPAVVHDVDEFSIGTQNARADIA